MADSTTKEQAWTDATVEDISDLSPTIKRVRLHVQDKSLTFKAGQWVDFSIHGVSPFTGYSMCSPPHLLQTAGLLDLAIKYSDYPPTIWVHEKCKIGDIVQIRVGGTFFYDPNPTGEREDLLLIAGGVGINPIISILQHFVHLNLVNETGRAVFLYSAQNLEELVFHDALWKISKDTANVKVNMFSTRKPVDEDRSSHKDLYRSTCYGRVSVKDVKDAIDTLRISATQT